ncbi:MmgE/PrpD family protein [Caballeronia glathei]|jgi:2-methylcitrate dehydratase PrpD|uniref:2-methylcitrate dehydratase n=1 Tax=Caballeronia glathei TaxID=60547 RepID=A0A069PQ02_9BURK|nr:MULTISPECIES: MmgE/PrpD family protein [Burkholderiaceae]KDR42773.1 2-methylcitrate dehydratase [Caballeronia glathei]TCK37030.1 2-methylcitrate dehydratase PrpD [Paraburkholderia sp. BL8N3]CDY79007.1 MmgE/PrpD family protein [Caballeronia glathei]
MSTETATTGRLAAQIVGSSLAEIPADVVHEAKRALLNITGCALGGSLHPAMDIAIDALGPYAGPPSAAVIGRRERFDPLFASMLNGISSHVHDYDDTTPRNYIHNSSPVASALFAYASERRVTGRDFLHAFIVGFEVVSRIGNATYPAHYDAGWHSTGSIGVFGAAVAIGRLLGLTQLQMTHAIGLAATQSAGLREMFGSMAKSFHPGRSAQSGYMAALLAQKGFTAGLRSLEGPRGFAAVQAAAYDLSKVADRFGEDFDLRVNAYKPFPCGIVIHPTIDACIQMRDEHDIDAADIVAVRLRVAPLVKDLCNKQHITCGLEGKFSIYHAAAIGLGRGKGGLGEFTDDVVTDPVLKRLREITEATGDERVSEDSVRVEVQLADGRVLSKDLAQSLGNLARPLSDAQLERKFADQADVIPRGSVDRLMSCCWNVERLADMNELIRLTVPPPA